MPSAVSPAADESRMMVTAVRVPSIVACPWQMFGSLTMRSSMFSMAAF
ncbi:MAG TPA: hypothetical protein VNM91_06750 [Dehalococcoidia bacterium]|nr:hypothetical protein [Dehalococcoidia bacterium]